MKYKQFNEKLTKLLSGFEVANKHLSTDTENIYIIVNRHIGDCFRVFSILHGIKNYYGENAGKFHFDEIPDRKSTFKKKRVIKKVFVVTHKSLGGIANLYPKDIDEIIILPRAEVDNLEFYAHSKLGIHENIICDEFAESYFGSMKDEGSWVRFLMYNSSDLARDICIPQSYFNNRSTMEITDSLKQRTEKVIKDYNIAVDKTIICCPAAKSSSMIDIKQWKLLADKFKADGFNVFTNVFGAEPVIDDTLPIEVPIDIAICLAKMGCKIIGVQCGLLDAIAQIKPEHLTVLSVIKGDMDKQYAKNRGSVNEVNTINGIRYLRIEHFEDDYVVNLIHNNYI